MPETDFSYSEVETPVAGTTIAPGWHLLTGWVWPRPGGHFVNVRARIDGRVFPAIHGYPRPDLAVHFGFSPRPAFAEFRVAVELRPGPVGVGLEVLTLEGHWTPFQTVTYTVAGELVPTITPLTPRPLNWLDFSRGLDIILRTRRTRPADSWVTLAVELAAELPRVPDQLYPPEPFIGHADEPAVVNRSRYGLIPMVGYLFHKTEKIARLWATADLHALQPLTLGRATANLLPHFPEYPAAGVSGYEGFVDVPLQLPNPVALRIYAETPDGKLHLVQVRLTRRHDAELEKYPYAGATAQDFAEALTAWRSALRVRGFNLDANAELHAAVDRLRQSYVRPTTAAVSADGAAIHVPSASQVRPALRHVILVSHNLNLEGAPLFLLDLARHLATHGTTLTVVSAAEGVLRERFAALGARVVILDPVAVFAARNATEVTTALAAVGQAFDFAAADLVITNTFTTFWAGLAAKQAGQRVLSYVHESTSPAAFYGGSVAPAVVQAADAALVTADAVSFTSDATRRYHAWPGRSIHAKLTPGWVDLAWIDAWLAAHPRETLRADFGVTPDQLLVTNVGTVCDRKGQLGFARAVDLFNRRHPALAARTRFILLGGREAYFDHFLRATLAGLALPNLVVHPETPDFLGYYFAADLTVCSSHEESSPRVVLEAMACGTPLLASAIAGISEIARDGIEATLVPRGDTPAWAEALARMLREPTTRREQATRARARIETEYAATIVLPQHTALAQAVARGEISP